MQKMNSVTGAVGPSHLINSKPTMPAISRQPVIERKISDPSSCAPKGERYPIPSFFEYRFKPRDIDTL